MWTIKEAERGIGEVGEKIRKLEEFGQEEWRHLGFKTWIGLCYADWTISNLSKCCQRAWKIGQTNFGTSKLYWQRRSW